MKRLMISVILVFALPATSVAQIINPVPDSTEKREALREIRLAESYPHRLVDDMSEILRMGFLDQNVEYLLQEVLMYAANAWTSEDIARAILDSVRPGAQIVPFSLGGFDVLEEPIPAAVVSLATAECFLNKAIVLIQEMQQLRIDDDEYQNVVLRAIQNGNLGKRHTSNSMGLVFALAAVQP